jgi:hypothetical protein
MHSIEETKKLLGNPNISDEEAEKIRNKCYVPTDIVVETLLEKIQKKGPPPERAYGKNNKLPSSQTEDIGGTALNVDREILPDPN